MNIAETTQKKPPVYIQQKLEEDYLDCLLKSVEDDGEALVVIEKNIKPMPLEKATLEKPALEKPLLKKEISCQLVMVAGLKLAIPLTDLEEIIAVPDSFEINNKTNKLCYAKLQWQQQIIFVINMQKILFSDGKENRVIPTNKVQKVVLLKHKNISFMCDEVMETVSLHADNVTWRSEISKRKWLAGTVKNLGFSVLNVQGLVSSVMILSGGTGK